MGSRHLRIPTRAVAAAAMALVVVACSSDARPADDPVEADEDAISESADEPATAAEPESPAEPPEELDERGPSPELVPYEQLTTDEQDGTQDVCAEIAWGDPAAMLAQEPADNVPDYLRWVMADPTAEGRELLLAVTAACAEIGWPPEM